MMVRIWQLLVAAFLVLTVFTMVSSILKGLDTTEADIGSTGAYVSHRGHIAGNVGLGQAIRVCTAVLPSAGVATRFNVFRLGEECPARVPTVQDRVDYVQVILPGTTVMVPADLR